jgi:signal peptidase I
VRQKRKSGASSLVELVVIVVIALALAFGIQAFLIKPYRIPSESMEPTLDIGQRVLVNRLGNRFADPHVGEIVVFHPPVGAQSQMCGDPRQGQGSAQACDTPTSAQSSQNFIKRVVAAPGDTITIVNGRVVRNGRVQADGFTRPCGAGRECNFPTPITIPKGYWYMMGDNRGASDDSRFWGPVPKKWIIGGAFFTYWPPGRIGPL